MIYALGNSILDLIKNKYFGRNYFVFDSNFKFIKLDLKFQILILLQNKTPKYLEKIILKNNIRISIVNIRFNSKYRYNLKMTRIINF